MIHDSMPGVEEHLNEKMRAGYVGIDPTADSLHIGHLVSVMMLKHMQLNGHKPIALVGGATGMIGDPSGKSQERNLLDEETLRKNQEGLKVQLKKFLDFESSSPNKAELVNNYDWMKGFTFLSFIRDVGKHITVNYMMAKDSVKKRLSGETADGMSFTEFTYQLVQGYDFLHLHRAYDCTIQMGGSDQWGNITTGTELIRRIDQGKAFAITCPLITKSDGSKFGKTESGNVWLDPTKTSPYKFYQFWLNTSDEDAEKYIKIFTILSEEKIKQLVTLHKADPADRILQRELGKELTIMVHSQEDYENAKFASELLFNKGQEAIDGLKKLNAQLLLDVFEGVPQATINKNDILNGLNIVEVLVEKGNFLASNGEARRELKQNAISVNKEKIDESYLLSSKDLIADKYILLQKGKKNYFLVNVE